MTKIRKLPMIQSLQSEITVTYSSIFFPHTCLIFELKRSYDLTQSFWNRKTILRSHLMKCFHIFTITNRSMPVCFMLKRFVSSQSYVRSQLFTSILFMNALQTDSFSQYFVHIADHVSQMNHVLNHFIMNSTNLTQKRLSNRLKSN